MNEGLLLMLLFFLAIVAYFITFGIITLLLRGITKTDLEENPLAFQKTAHAITIIIFIIITVAVVKIADYKQEKKERLNNIESFNEKLIESDRFPEQEIVQALVEQYTEAVEETGVEVKKACVTTENGQIFFHILNVEDYFDTFEVNTKSEQKLASALWGKSEDYDSCYILQLDYFVDALDQIRLESYPKFDQ